MPLDKSHRVFVATAVGASYGVTLPTLAEAQRSTGGVHTIPTNFVSGVGVAGVDNTAQVVVTIVLPANTLTQLGDRVRIRTYWRGDAGVVITGDVALNGVLVAHTTDGGAASLQVGEAWLHYIDNTHANIIENEAGAVGPLSAPNVAGFDFAVAQNITISQNAVVNNHIVVFFLAADIFPKGT